MSAAPLGWMLLTFGAAIGLQTALSPALPGYLGLEGTQTPVPRAPSLIFGAAVRLQVTPLGRLGLVGTHPPAPRATSVTLCAAIGLHVAPLPALLGYLALERTHPPPLRAPFLWMRCAHQPINAPRGARWPTCPLPPRPEGVYTPIAQSIAMRGAVGGRDAPGCAGEHRAALLEVPPHSSVAGVRGSSWYFLCLICPPPPPSSWSCSGYAACRQPRVPPLTPVH